MKAVSTASAKKSIWKPLDKKKFYDDVDDLQKLDPIPSETPHPVPSITSEDGERLPFETERHLADDFAFIAAYKHGADWITATGVEVLSGFSGLLIRLAANEGVEDCVVHCLNSISAILKRCAQKGTSQYPATLIANALAAVHLIVQRIVFL